MQMPSKSRLQIPEALRLQLLAYRHRVWKLKLIEATAGAAIGVLLGFFAVYVLDRFFDTSVVVRFAVLGGAVLACAMIPLAVDRWVLRRRRLDQLASLLSETYPSVGDQLLGVLELSGSESEQARSPELVEAAIAQVSADVGGRDLSSAIPNPQYKQRLGIAGMLLAGSLVLLVVTGAAAKNAWARFLTPWQDTPRYTFAAVDPLPEKIIVPHGERFDLSVQLTPETEWVPESAQASIAGATAHTVELDEDSYAFELPAQIKPGELELTVGDYYGVTKIEPMTRPELSLISAEIELPKYLGRSEKISKEIRGGTLTAVRGSTAVLQATASRTLASAHVNHKSREPNDDQFSTDPIAVDEMTAMELQWQDTFGLSGQKPLELTIEGVDDEAPSLVCESLPRRKVLLDSEVIRFQIRAHDDFGVRRVGVEWQGLDTAIKNPAKGEALIGSGGSESEMLELAATFSAEQFGIAPQPIAVRVFVEDYLPGRERIYSQTCVYDVLSPEQHAIWITEQLSRWHRMALDVRDREKQLYEGNKQLRELTAAELDQPEAREELSKQAAAERANGRRLENLTRAGDGLLKEAMRNSEIGVGHLDSWAEMMQVLKDISANRMPTVADLLKQAAKSKQATSSPAATKGPKAGQNKLDIAGAGAPKKPGEPQPPKPAVPTLTDIESSQNQMKPGEPKEPSESKAKQPRLTLPTTMLAGNGKAKPKPKPKTPAGEKTDEAVKVQKDLLAEFEKVADELNEILANLEGSTLVKRLKASSRKQQQVASKLASVVPDSFGVSEQQKAPKATVFAELAEVEAGSSHEASTIMDDMAAYFERSRFARFKAVLDDMRTQDVTAGLRDLSDDLRVENGLSIAQAEFWGDTFDRWAEDLVEVTKGGECPGCKAKGSLPPSIVLEVLQILEREIDLREQTRVASQAKAAVTVDQHLKAAQQLSESQDKLSDRITAVIGRIEELPDAQQDFGKELKMLSAVSSVMRETTEILATPETGPPAIAAETEVIELLLASKRFNPNGGGGGGANPGGGGSGDTQTAALALVGAGRNEKAGRQEQQATQAAGLTGPGLPEEFRAGLDEYFNQLENWKKP